MNTIDVETIMDEIRKEATEKGEYLEPVCFDEIPVMGAGAAPECTSTDQFNQDFFRGSLAEMNQKWEIRAYRPLYGNSIKIFIKRVIRKLMKFYIEPITFDGTEFNSHTVRCMNSVAAYIAEQQNRELEATQELEYLKKQMKLLEQEMERLRGN